jgi:hypothetical protein
MFVALGIAFSMAAVCLQAVAPGLLHRQAQNRAYRELMTVLNDADSVSIEVGFFLDLDRRWVWGRIKLIDERDVETFAGFFRGGPVYGLPDHWPAAIPGIKIHVFRGAVSRDGSQYEMTLSEIGHCSISADRQHAVRGLVGWLIGHSRMWTAV